MAYLGQLASELLAQQLAVDGPTSGTGELRWTSRNLGVPSVDLEDKETLHALLDHGA